MNSNNNLQNQSTLTHFAPLSPEEESSGFGSLLSRFFKRNGAEESKGPNNSKSLERAAESSCEELFQKKKDENNPKADGAYEYRIPINLAEGRSLPNVLRRISNLLAVKNSGKQSYNDNDLKQYWMPDSVSKECYDCGEKFTTFRRRHHCRVCGQIFCSRCCNQEIPGKIMNCTGDLRVCTYCGKVVLSYLQSPDMATQDHLSADLRALQEDLQTKFGDPVLMETVSRCTNSSITPDREDSTARRKPSLGYQEEKFANARSDTGRSSMRCLLDEATHQPGGLIIATHRFRLRTYTNCFLASHLVDWLVLQNKAANRIQGVVLGQAMLQSGYIECISLDSSQFTDNHSLYRVVPVETVREEGRHDSSADSESEYVPSESSIKTSSSIFNLDLNLEEKTAHLSKPATKDNEDNISESSRKVPCNDLIGERGVKVVTDNYSSGSEVPPAIEWNFVQESALSLEDRKAYTILRSSFPQHCSNYFRQLLNMESVSQSWAEVLSHLVEKAVDSIRPENLRPDDMDIRLYVQVKKISGGDKSECGIINGVVCSKNVAHKAMATKIVNPKILLLSSAIMYQRVEGKFVSLEPVIMQEQEYVDRAVAKIVGLGPNVVLVGKSVSRLAQESLLPLGITLVLNVKPSVLERVARVTGADIISSVDPQLRSPKLGKASFFSVTSYVSETGRKKTLMMFEGCPNPHLGCTLLLRGAPVHELAKLKKATKAYIFALYNSRLELSYLMDAEAQPPSLEVNVFEESETEGKSASQGRPQKRLRLEERLSEEKLCASKPVPVEAVSDFSDPLRAYVDPEEDMTSESSLTQQEFLVSELPLYNKFRKALEDNILSISPYLKFNLPYLESENGRNCPLRMFFGKKIYWSAQFSDEIVRPKCVNCYEQPTLSKKLETVKLKEVHAFVKATLTQPADAPEIQRLLAHFRAAGGRLPLVPYEDGPPPKQQAVYSGPKDVLDPENHQRLAVLLSSYSPMSRVSPEFCVNPSIVEMELYGRNDIALGLFLERYCFRFDCTSASCDVPLSAHTRRFVHSQGALNIKLRNLESPLPSGRILMWTWCPQCTIVTPIRTMSPSTWALSFAKYLELRFYGDMYNLRGKNICPHSLHHDCIQYFGLDNILASFAYSKISVWEIWLPPKILQTEREPFEERKNIIEEEMKTYYLMITQFFNTVLNKIYSLPISDASPMSTALNSLKQTLQKDQATFKTKIEEIQQKLGSAVDDNTAVDQIWWLDDMVVMLKRCFAETICEWNTRLINAEASLSKRKEDKRKSLESRTSQNTLNDIADIIGVTEIIGEDQAEVLEYHHMPEDNSASGLDSDDQTLPLDSVEGEALDTDDGDGSAQIAMDFKLPVSDKKSVKTILSQLLPNSSQNTAVQSPLSQTEHHTLPLGYLMPITVYEREPSSIIAYALSSHDYKQAVDQLTKTNDQQPSSPSSKRKTHLDVTRDSMDTSSLSGRSGVLSFLRTPSTGSSEKSKCNDGVTYASSPSDVFTDEESKEGKLQKSQSPYIEMSFADSTASFHVKVYFPEEFSRLRSLVLPEGEEGYIRSLSRCVSWAASGGKSGSNFNKTKDDRFILKEMTRLETQIFVEFAPQYFTYMETCVKTKAPTLLGKILGVYRISCRSETSNTTFRSSLLVMEHLFHARVVENKFDLKGSMRNRLVDTTVGAHRETVLLDENLLNMTCDDPLYILPHSKTVLMQAIHNDTQFLSTQSVMDYSLLVGLDISNRELIVGIIDYIRTFTWDKKLETMVKRIGQGGKQPTIISPDEYRKRFIAAMNRYFLPVPDRWAGLGLGVD